MVATSFMRFLNELLVSFDFDAVERKRQLKSLVLVLALLLGERKVTIVIFLKTLFLLTDW